ncbi:GMC family oxidoreductase [Oligoflexia bacterium]|nr:GMC family oxidoreductase [Oligoflexia bacterium]
MTDFDVCVIGSGAGGGPVALALSEAGYSVVVLEKGAWFKETDFYKDELAAARRSAYSPDLRKEPHVIETKDGRGSWTGTNTYRSGWNFWNGNCIGGATNFMSGFFHRLKPLDFKLRSTFGPIKDADVVDWPITYANLEPYYDKVEQLVGISGKVTPHEFLEPRSSPDFPYPPTVEHPIAKWVDTACSKMGLNPVKTPRAILSRPAMGRTSCSYNGYCGGFGCATGAKGSSRAALLSKATATGRCEIRTHAVVSKLISDNSGRVTGAEYINQQGRPQQVDAKIYVVACQAIETARLLLLSTGPRHKNGLANGSGRVGKNLLFAGGGAGSGKFVYAKFSPAQADELKTFGTFINRTLQDWYVINDPKFGPRQKGGIIDIIFASAAPIARAARQIRGGDKLIWGAPLQEKLKSHFHDARYVKLEAFCDWLPDANTHVTLDPGVKDIWGRPVARVRVGGHFRNIPVGWYLAEKGAEVLRQMGADNVFSFASGTPPTNLVAGTCRFGDDPTTSVLNSDCRAHEVENLYVTDGSFMPTGGSVPYTWTIYANAFRVADQIIKQLGGGKQSTIIRT